MNKFLGISHKVQTQGSAKVEHAYIWRSAPGLVAIGVQTVRRSILEATGGGDEDGPTIVISAKDGDEPTVISFPQYDGWDIWSADVCKYTVHLCLYKK